MNPQVLSDGGFQDRCHTIRRALQCLVLPARNLGLRDGILTKPERLIEMGLENLGEFDISGGGLKILKETNNRAGQSNA